MSEVGHKRRSALRVAYRLPLAADMQSSEESARCAMPTNSIVNLTASTAISRVLGLGDGRSDARTMPNRFSMTHCWEQCPQAQT
jgi:hypothetical protein